MPAATVGISPALASGVTTIVVTRADGTKYSVGNASDVGKISLETDWIGVHDVKQLLRRLSLEASEGTFKVEIYAKNNRKDVGTLVASKNLTGDEVATLRTGSYRFYKFKILDENADSRWMITGLDVWGEPTSRRVY